MPQATKERTMPIEIKELHIKVAVNSAPHPGGGRASEGESRDALVAECVEQVLQILQNKAER
ncbi:DUF5908 family protein [Citrifermentans bemidjiense]|nr:DUF5908 family protein [Citrifermentans bemidjiense]